MRICLLGDFSGTHDEGMKNISCTIKDILSSRHEVFTFNAKNIFRITELKKLRFFNPEVVHYLHGPTIRSLSILRFIKVILSTKTKFVVSATRPYFSKYNRWAIPFLKPAVILTQSVTYEEFFKEKGCSVIFCPNGVDCKKFNVFSKETKNSLRKDFGLPKNKKIILHVGHIKSNRMLDIFQKIQSIPFVQVVIIGGTSQNSDEALKHSLQKHGVIVLHKYFENISKAYNCADLYVFPVRDTGSDMPEDYNQVGAIDLPLSVLEAMACNLPVVTTRFGALPRLFSEGDGFHYASNEKEILSLIKFFSFDAPCNTREKVLPLDWVNIVHSMEMHYKRLLN